MRDTTSRHLQPLRADGKLRVDTLLELLQYNSSETDKGKKRAGSPVLKPAQRPKKRFRKVTPDLKDTVKEDSEIPETLVDVYQHVCELQYSPTTLDSLDGDGDVEVVAPEDGILEWVKQRRKQASKRKKSLANYGIGCGTVRLVLIKNELFAVIDTPTSCGVELFKVPNIDPDFTMSDYDFRHKYLKNPLVAFAILDEAGRAEVSASLRLVILDESDRSRLPFQLELHVHVALLCPSIFKPVLYSNKTDTAQIEEAQRRALLHLCPLESVVGGKAAADIPLFYSTLGPAPSVQYEQKHQPSALRSSLLPFQRRSVAWLLAREHKQVTADGEVIPLPLMKSSLFWEPVTIKPDEQWYVNHVTGELRDTLPGDHDILGGILAEEPGLGKTLESIALILLNPSVGRSPSKKSWNPEARIHVKEIKTTLVVTPNSLAQQWSDELKLHAPTLKVLVYDGWEKVPVPIVESKVHEDTSVMRTKATVKSTKKGKAKSSKANDAEGDLDDEVVDWCTWVNTYDVCITTYNVLQHDLGVARPPKERPRRTIATYHEREWYRSPLVMCEWYRVIMDEVQMVGGGQTEEMVSLIPRLSSFAVSGTPARSQVADLLHVLNFLRVEPILKAPKIWPRLLKPGYASQFKELFQRYGLRTMKAAVKDELTIPKQTRYLVPIILGKVERHVYDQNFERALLDLGFDARGVAVSGNHEIDTGALRIWLRKLRGICTHPQVGQLQNQTDKRGHKGVKTMTEVLDGMKEQNWRNMMEDRRTKVQTLITNAQLCQRDEGNSQRYSDALTILLAAEREGNSLIADINSAIDRHNEAGKALMVDPETVGDASVSKDKGKGRETSSNFEDDGLPQTAAAEEHRNKLRAMQSRLREGQIAMHRVKFILGDVYHMLGNEKSEGEAYGAAEELRRILLRSTEEAANYAMNQLKSDTSERRLSEKELQVPVPYCGSGGAKSKELLEEANRLIDELLNPQSALLWKWRTHLIGLLTESLTSADEKPDGDEYARTLETQGEAETYLQVYAALLADRREALTAERTLLAVLDVKEKKARRTKASKKAQAAAIQLHDEDVLIATEDVELRPEDDVLKIELHEERKAIIEEFGSDRAVKSIMVDLNNIAARIAKDDDPEKVAAQDGAKRLREFIADQNRLMEKLQADLNRLRKAFNERIQYFRQLQEISDTVQEVSWEDSTLEGEMNRCKEETTALDMKINTGRARQRYLEHLAKSQEDGTTEEDEESCCILCKCDFTRGFITQCAHVFCEDCIKMWTQRKEGKACPVCRVAIHPDQMQRFIVGQRIEESSKPQLPSKLNIEVIPKSRRQIDYNLISEGVLDSIQMMESHGSYGSKIETLVKHLLYVQIVEPGAKSIVFSAWADSLRIIEHALERNYISFLRIDQGSGKGSAANKFKADPDIHVLLLHGERENAGLNVTCASRVFLVESVVHHAFEIQAIARIDRMGQTRPTEVYCYYAEDTVERNILDLAARRGQSLYTKGSAAGTLITGSISSPNKNSVDATTKKRTGANKGDFVFKTDDMLAIFFPHLFEDIEYLVPTEALAAEESQPTPSSNRQHINADAGPSRIPY